MDTVKTDKSEDKFSLFSSVKDDIWSGEKRGSNYEWWYFDALSDDGREAIVIIFLDNFIFSPRYNRSCSSDDPLSDKSHYPAVAFTYYVDGKPVYRSVAEYTPEEFSPDKTNPGCRIGKSSFVFTSAPYGSGYSIRINLPLSGKRRVHGELEWLSVESDLMPEHGEKPDNSHCWNLVAPRSDVTGTITMVDRKGRRKATKFRGTGYHDHNSDTRWMPGSIDHWFWGRVHFPFATAVYYRYKELGESEPVSKLIMIRDGVMDSQDAEFEFSAKQKRDKFGIAFPKSILISSRDHELKVSMSKAIDSSFFYLRFLSDIDCRTGDDHSEEVGITEYLCPRRLKNRWLWRLTDFRIGRNDKGAFLP